MNTNTSEAKEGIDKRTIRAATESMSVDRYVGKAGEYDVYAESGEVYRVNLVDSSCSCPDEEHNAPADGCKHYRRVEMETGQRGIPDLDGETDVERMIAAHARTNANTNEVATDGGRIVEGDAESRTLGYTEHIESPEQGGKKYVRCEGCERELLSELGGRDSLPHADNCPNTTH